jgi:hypothetical protein
MTDLTFDIKTLVKLTRAIVRAEASKESRCKALADYIVSFHNPSNDFKEEYNRLTKDAKLMATNAGAECDRNTWQSVNNYIALGMAPHAMVELTIGKGEDEITHIVNAEDCTTAKQVRAAGKAIRDMNELGRAPKETTNVSKGAVQSPADHAASVLAMFGNAEDRVAIVAALKAVGVRVVITKDAPAAMRTKPAKKAAIA